MAHTWVRRFQVREEPGRQLRFLVDVRQPPSDVERHTLTEIVESSVGTDFEIAIEFVDQIPTGPNGKLQFLVPLPRSEQSAA
jgi:hypothetical protein